MPRKPWVPLPHEADSFCNIYIDESSQTKHRFLVLGGLVVPHSHVDLFESDVIAARDPIIAPFRADGRPRVIKWEKVNAYNLASYKKVLEVFWRFEMKHKLNVGKHVDMVCLAVDTSKKPLKVHGDGDIETGFNKEIYFLCAALIGRRFKRELFHIYADRRTTKSDLNAARKIMNYGSLKYGDTRPWPFRRLRFEDPERCQSLQVVDILIGALAYKLNGHYQRPDANKAKKELCDYVLIQKAKVRKVFESSPHYRRRFTIIHRDGSPYVAPWFLKKKKQG